jgi:hypothetical protein
MINKWKINPSVFLTQLFETLFLAFKNQPLLKMSF